MAKKKTAVKSKSTGKPAARTVAKKSSPRPGGKAKPVALKKAKPAAKPAKAAKKATPAKKVVAKKVVASRSVKPSASASKKNAPAKVVKTAAVKKAVVKKAQVVVKKAVPAKPAPAKTPAPTAVKTPAPVVAAPTPAPKPAPAKPAPTPVKKRPAKERVVMEFYLNSSPNALYELLSTPSGFSEWYCQDVDVRGDQYTFIWDGEREETTMIGRKAPEVIRFRRNDDEDPEAFFEFRVRIDAMTNEVCLVVTDHAWPHEIQETRNLWTSQIETLGRVLGA